MSKGLLYFSRHVLAVPKKVQQMKTDLLNLVKMLCKTQDAKLEDPNKPSKRLGIRQVLDPSSHQQAHRQPHQDRTQAYHLCVSWHSQRSELKNELRMALPCLKGQWLHRAKRITLNQCKLDQSWQGWHGGFKSLERKAATANQKITCSRCHGSGGGYYLVNHVQNFVDGNVCCSKKVVGMDACGPVGIIACCC